MCPLPSTYPETADEQEDKNFLGITADKPERQIFRLFSIRCRKVKLEVYNHKSKYLVIPTRGFESLRT